jgi:hypothetical protein
MSETRRAALSARGKARWAAKSDDEKRRHLALSKAAYQLRYPERAPWPERWVADEMAR